MPQELDLMPMKLERSKAPHLLEVNEARILQAVDIQWLYGRLVRGPGVAETQITNSTYPILGAYVGTRRDGRKIVFDGDSNGTVRASVGDYSSYATGGSNLVSTGPTELWVRHPGDETDDEDGGVGDPAEPGCDCDCCGGCC
jgi:hypothetical protein